MLNKIQRTFPVSYNTYRLQHIRLKKCSRDQQRLGIGPFNSIWIEHVLMSYHYIQTIIGLYPVQRRNVKWIHAKTLSRELKGEKKKKKSQHSLKTVFLNMVNHSFIFRTAKLSNYNHIQRLAWYIPSHTACYLVTSVCQSEFQLGTWQWNECISTAHFGAQSP